jgi:large subunit ribosomal protein L29
MSATNFATLDDAALVAELSAKQVTLTRTQFAHAANKLENTSSLGRMRTEIARIKTEIRRREIAAGLPKNSLESTHRVTGVAAASASSAASGGFLGGLVDKLDG